MVSMLKRFFAQGGSEDEDDILGCDMAPAPSVMGLLFDPQREEGVFASTSSIVGGPFTTMAQAPIRDS